jgi:formylglycine-generating enzyme required for sulfatase activity
MGGPVFISHSSRDVKIARGICEAIETRGVACWISGRDVGPGENYGDAIVDAIERARAMVLVFSSNANNSEEIKKELALASQHRVTVIPVRVEDITPSQAFRYELATRQWIDMFVDWDQALKRLTDKIVAIQGIGDLEAPPPRPESARQPALPAPPRRLGPLLGAAAAIVAVITAGVLYWPRAGTGGDPPRWPPLASQAGANPPTPIASAPAATAAPAAAALASVAPAVALPAAAVSAPTPAAPGPAAPTIAAASGSVSVASVSATAPSSASASSTPQAPVVHLVSTEPAEPSADPSGSRNAVADPARSAPVAPPPAPIAEPTPALTAPKPVVSASIGPEASAAAGNARATPLAAAAPVADLPLSPAAAPSAPIVRNFAAEPARSAIDPGSPTPTVNAAPVVPASPAAPTVPIGTIALAPVVAAGAPSVEPATAVANVPPAPAVANPPAKAVVVSALAAAVEPAKPARDVGVKSFKDCDDCPEMVAAPSGAALIGSPAQETARMPHEPAPSEAIIPAPFAVGRYDVTFDEWDACVAAGGCNNWRPGDFGWGRGRQPVIFVSWNDAHAYVAWLSQKTGKPYRLLSETEWEYAARGCTTTACPNQPFWFGVIKPEIANYDARYAYQGSPKGLARRRAVAADEGPPNPFGLSNMLGNVRQWVEDCWSANPGPPPPGGAPRLDGDCSQRVTRGGSYDDKPQELRAAARSWQTAETRSQKVGFRVARALDP